MKCGDANGQPASDAVDKLVRAVAEDGASTLGDAGATFSSGGRVGFGRVVGMSTRSGGAARKCFVLEPWPSGGALNGWFKYEAFSRAGIFFVARHTSIIGGFRRGGVEQALRARVRAARDQGERKRYVLPYQGLAQRPTRQATPAAGSQGSSSRRATNGAEKGCQQAKSRTTSDSEERRQVLGRAR